MIKLSIIIPVYKVEKYIEKCLKSIIEQEKEDFEIECILIDDCSPDNSVSIANKVINEYHGNNISFLIIRHDENKGISVARNTGIRAAKGDYILFVDSDDYIPKDSYSYLVKYAIQYPEVDVFESNAFDKKKATQINPYLPSSVSIYEDKEQIYAKFVDFQFSVYVWNKMIKRSVILNHNLFFRSGIIHEDILWNYKLFSSINSVLLLPRVTYIYEYNPSSITNTTIERVEEDVKSHLFICNEIFEMPPQTHNKKNNLFVEYHMFIYTFLLRAIELSYRYPISNELSQSLNIAKKRMLSECTEDYRLLLTLFVLIMYKPFSLQLRIPLFRRLYNKMVKIIKRCSKMTDTLHTNRYYHQSS